ncbi:hypothetical protein F8M41_004504 [Gigaspora margarita]|uniref:F-box domain-containing protein n=1 Tax=Gigaspora margarita TaxID=4874 RepID=A0A8H4AXP3_GIGMA|nr:hypothetical protein F8M41_004504 [Gigaspora margarita]
MASKIFMGDMPELMGNILNNNLNNEFCFLYSCVLVNRHWCQMSIPILWQTPFSFDKTPLFISQYFSSLDENEKFGLNEYGLDANVPNTLFNYASFLKVLNLSSIEIKVEEWIDFQNVDECGAILHKLDFHLSDHEFKPEIFYSLGRNEQFFSQLQNLSLGQISGHNSESATVLLRILAKNTTTISVLKLERVYSDSKPQLLHMLAYIIKSQEHLRKFSLYKILEKSGTLLQRLKLESRGGGIYEEPLLLKTLNSFCPNITYLNFLYIEFSTQLLELISNLQKLQFLTSLWCINCIPEEELIRRLIQFAELLPLTLQYLDLRNIWLNEYIDILLNHCNAPLKKLLIYRHDNERTVKALIEFCIRKRTLNCVGVNSYFDESVTKEVEGYVTLAPSKGVIVNC